MNQKIPVRCRCGRTLRVHAELLGGVGKCPACGRRVRLEGSPGRAEQRAGARHAVRRPARVEPRTEKQRRVGERSRVAEEHPTVELDWYAMLDGRKRGPLSFEELAKLVSQGRVDRDTLVRQGAEGAWIPAAEAKGRVRGTRASRSRVKRRDKERRRAEHRERYRELLQLGAGALAVAVLLGLWLLLSGGTDPDERPRQPTTTEIASRTLPSVAAIRGSRSGGSGFVVDAGLLVTNYHVIENELLRNVVVEFPNNKSAGRGETAKLRYVDPSLDLAFLTIESKVDPLSLAPDHEFKAGEEILIVGSPGVGPDVVLYNAVARGLLSTLAEIDGQEYYQLDVSVNPGNSGGPVVDGRGDVVGVLSAKAAEKDRLAFAIPLADLRSSLIRLQATSTKDARRVQARHRLRVAERTILASAQIYFAAMRSYVSVLAPRRVGGAGSSGGLPVGIGEFLKKLDRHLLAELRLEERLIRNDDALSTSQRQRFGRLWRTYAELKSAVDAPEGSYVEYAKQCEQLGTSLQRLAQTIIHEHTREGGH